MKEKAERKGTQVKRLLKRINNLSTDEVAKILEEISDGDVEMIGISTEEYPSDIPDDTDEEENDDYKTNSYAEHISFIEMAIINEYLHKCLNKKSKEIKVSSYGETDGLGILTFGGNFNMAKCYWFNVKFKNDVNDFMFQTKSYVDSRGILITQLYMTTKTPINGDDFSKRFKEIKSLAFNNSEYKGKCIKVKLKESEFKGIEIIDIKQTSNELILNDTQRKFITHFVNRVGRGGNARYLLNGEPDTGKTECIREIARKLIPEVTFIIPDFVNGDDLTSILEACEIFDNAVIIMDDIDLFLGSRDNGSYTRLLGEFLSFFDGVKKRKISLLASTNDKGLVDKAAERTGRFNFTLDFSFLDETQIIKVCEIHLPKKWQIEEVYESLMGKIDGKKVKITGAFIANLADNIKEMSNDDPNWSKEDTISLIKESYKGFYSSQVKKEHESMGFVK